MVCKTWSQPDGNHLRGLCTNELFAEGQNNTCSICISPVDGRIPGECFCPLPYSPRGAHYLRITTVLPYTPTFSAETCWFDTLLGDFVLTGFCGGASAERQVISHATLGAPFPTPPCEFRTTTPPRWEFAPVSVSTIGGKRFAFVRVRSWYAIAGYQGPPPYPNYQFGLNAFNLGGVIPWCENNRGSGTLSQEVFGIFGATLTGVLSTEPFT